MTAFGPGSSSLLKGKRLQRRGFRPGRSVAALLVSLLALGLLTVPVGPAAAADLPTPVLRYTFDGVSGTGAGSSIADDGPNGLAAAIVGAGATVGTGPTGAATDKALVLPGGASTSTAAYVQLPALTTAFAGKTDATLSFWAKWAGGSACQWAATLGTAQNAHVFTSPSCGNVQLSAINVGGETRASAGTVLSQQWSQIALVLTGGSRMAVYRDGVQVAQSGALAASRVASALFPAGSTIGGYLGKSFYSADPYFAGALDDVRVYDTALSGDQIAVLGNDVRAAWIDQAAAAIQLGSTTDLVGDLALPTTGAQGSTISWTTSDPTVISASGQIKPSPTAVGSATLTARVSIGNQPTTRDFPVTVAKVSPALAVSSARDRLALPVVVAAGFPLPRTLTDGVTIDWSTTSQGASTAAGVLTGSGDVTVQATIGYPGAPDAATKSLRVTVLPADQAWDLVSYTRTPDADVQKYSSNLAFSMHLALGADRSSPSPLNENYGILFASSVPGQTHETIIRNLDAPAVFHRKDGGYGVLAVRTLTDGTPDDTAATSLLYFTSDDLLHFTERGLVKVNPAGTGVRSPQVSFDSVAGSYLVFWRDSSGAAFNTQVGDFLDAATVGQVRSGGPVAPGPVPSVNVDGALPFSTIPVDGDTAKKLQQRFGRVVNTGSSVAQQGLAVGQQLDLSGVRADLTYNDGSTGTLPVDWNAADLAAVNTAAPGSYQVRGTVRQTAYPYPFIEDGADPTVFKYNGGYLYVATRNEFSNPGIWIRKADTIAGLRTAPEVRIVSEASGLRSPYWAPELHIVGGKLTVLFASNPEPSPTWTVQAMAMQLRDGGDPTNPADWGAPAGVKRADGALVVPNGINLDMTYYEDTYQGRTRAYVMWSGRVSFRDAWLYIATVDPANPWKLTSTPVAVTHNPFGWNKNRAPIDEGPFFIRHGDTLNVTFSGSATDHTYTTGRLTAPAGADLLDPAVWTIDNYPVLKSDWNRTPRELGPGHNSFSEDEDGNEIFVFHARDDLSTGSPRDSNIRRVHWTADGYPILDMTADEEVAPANRAVTVTVTVAAAPLDLSSSVSTRCIASRVVLSPTAANRSSVPVDITFDSTHGSKSFTAVDPGKNAFHGFSTRLSQIPAGTVSMSASGVVNGVPATWHQQVAYEARTCN